MESLRLTICGNPECTVILKKILECSSCKACSYCSRDCQWADWSNHREYCSSKDLLSKDAHRIHAYSRHHRNTFLAIVLEFFAFTMNFSHLEGLDQKQWLSCLQKQYLHITLCHVDNAPRGRHNKIAFATARLSDIDLLPDDYPHNICRRLETRFPAICLGYSIINPLNPSQMKITTYTHPFTWPAAGVQLLGLLKAVRLIWLSKWILQKEAMEVQAERRDMSKHTK